jgi:ABC-type uncharacterized transport system permease subunit
MIANVMTLPQLIVFHVGVVTLIAAALLGLATMYRRGPGAGRWVQGLVAASFAVFTAVGIWRWVSLGQIPVTDVASATAGSVWCLLAAYLVASAFWDVARLSAFLLCLAILLGLMALGMRIGTTDVEGSEGHSTKSRAALHVGPLVAGLALFGFAAAASAGFLVQHSALKGKGSGRLARGLPSLEKLETIAHVAIEIGLPLTAAGVVIGVALQIQYGRLKGRWYVEPSVILAVVTVAVFGVLLWAVHSRRLRGSRAAGLVLAGFALVLLTLVFGGH